MLNPEGLRGRDATWMLDGKASLAPRIPPGWWEHPTAEGKLRLGSSDEVERHEGTQDSFPKVGKAVLTLTLASAVDLSSLKGSC